MKVEEKREIKTTIFRHPGFGRRKASPFPKGRQLNDQASAEVSALIGDPPYPRDMLIEYLHLIQDRYACLSVAHIHALADLMKLAQTEVYEVASFYAHFDVKFEGEETPPLTIRVCDSLSCALKGADLLINQLKAQSNPEKIRILNAPCMGRCHQAPVAEVGHKHFTETKAEDLLKAANENDTHPVKIEYPDLKAAQADGAYQILSQCIDGSLSADQIIETLSQSGLRGLGGAGFPTGRKWSIVRNFKQAKLMAVNADEGEPGTIKDHYYLAKDPHRFLEGMLIGAWVVGAEAIYIYLRDEYPDIRAILFAEIEKLEKAGLTAHTKIYLRRGAGAYICGEESAMIESIEGKRGLPRHRPPYVAEEGIFNQPTLVNNVETLYWVRDILQKGPEFMTAHGVNDRKGLRSFSVSGRVQNPGVKFAPAGITIRQLIDDYCGGMLDGHQLKGYLPGGASGGILPASMDDIPLDFDTIQPYGGFIGSAAVVVLSDHDNIADAALNLMRFFEFESCGQCTPCRVGTEKAVKLMKKKKWNRPLLEELSQTMMDSSICGLGQAAPNPILTLFKYFPEEVPS